MDLPAEPVSKPIPIRHGDTLEAKPAPTVRDLLGDEAAERAAIALRFCAMEMQKRREFSMRAYYYQVARLFQ